MKGVTMSDDTPDRRTEVRAARAMANAFQQFMYPTLPPPVPRDLTEAEYQDIEDWTDTLMHEWEASRAARQAREGAEERSPDA
jgi:hypothetical protein